MLQLAAAHVVPVEDGLLRRIGTELRVPDHPAQEADVRPANVASGRVLQLRDGLDVELELVLFRHVGGQSVIETVERVEQDQGVGARLEASRLRGPLAALEVVDRNIDRASSVQFAEMLVDQWEVERLRRLEVVVPELVSGMQLQIEEIVVERQRDHVDSRGLQALHQLVGGRGLARAARTGDDDEPEILLLLEDGGGGSVDDRLVAGVTRLDQLAQASGTDDLVQSVDGVAALVDRPVERLPHLLVGEILDSLQAALGAHPLATRAVEDVRLGGTGVTVLDQHTLDHVLDLLDRR